jgi:hypothetical protein
MRPEINVHLFFNLSYIEKVRTIFTVKMTSNLFVCFRTNAEGAFSFYIYNSVASQNLVRFFYKMRNDH